MRACRRRLAALAVLVTGGLGLGACAVGPDYTAPDVDVPDTFRTDYEASGIADALWWTGFSDPVLDALIDDALANNVEVGIAVARLAEAGALVRAERSDLFPILDGAATGSVRKPPGADAQASGSAGLVFSFTPDLFGQQRRRIEQARAFARAQGFTLEDVRRLTVASVADRYVDLRRNQARLDLLDNSLDLQRQTLEIVRQRLGAGLAADLDVQRATADLARTQATRGTFEALKARSENALAVLLGEAPADGVAPGPTENPIPVYAGGPPAGVPAALIRRRPDVLSAEEDLKRAVAGIGVEIADLYPALRLPGQVTASLGGAQSTFGDVTSLISAALDIPLFDAGARRAEVRAARQNAEAARLIYEQTVLISLSQVENALADIEGQRFRRDQLRRAIGASEQSFKQLNALYREGLASFIDILDAQRTLIASREATVEAEADLARAVIDLYRALGAPTGTDDLGAMQAGLPGADSRDLSSRQVSGSPQASSS
ncbi:MAG: efflux transporter outer membrane subunit [Alphaproteobacteria bacterium]